MTNSTTDENIWSERELERKDTIIQAARKQFDLDIDNWWSEQTELRGKDSNYQIKPYLIWKKANILR